MLAIQLSARLIEEFLTPGVFYQYSGCANLNKELRESSERIRSLRELCTNLAYCYTLREKNYEFYCFSLCGRLMEALHDYLPWEVMTREDYASMKLRASRIMSITAYIDRNFKRKLLLSEIADKEKLSMIYLSHFFKETLGMSFLEYLNRKRFSYACVLMDTTDRKILDISLSSGFSDVRYLNRTFLAQYGCTPRQYRQGRALADAQVQGVGYNNQQFFTEEETLRLLPPRK